MPSEDPSDDARRLDDRIGTESMTARPSRPSAVRAWYTVLVLMLAYMMSLIDRIILTLLVDPIKRDLAISDTQFSLLTGLAFAMCYSIAAIPIAVVADRTSRRAVIGIGVAFWSAMTALCGLASNYVLLFLARVGVGIGEASLSPAAASLLSDIFPKEKLGKALAIFSIGGIIGTGLAYLFGGVIVGLVREHGTHIVPIFGAISGWQLVFLIVALPGLPLALLMATIPEPRSVQGAKREANPVEISAHIRRNGRAYGFYIAGYTFYNAVFYGLISWLPALLTRHFGIEMASAGVILGTIIVTAGPLAMLAAGILVDRLTSTGRGNAASIVALAGCLGLGIFAVAMPLAPGPSLSLACLFLLYFFASMTSGVGQVGIQMLTPPHLRARATAIFLLIISLFGLTLGPLSVALLTDKVFASPSAIHLSMALTGGVFPLAAAGLFYLGLGPFARTARGLGNGNRPDA